MTNSIGHATTEQARVVTARSIDEAAFLIAHERYEPLAGGTWVMRSSTRGETSPSRLVDISRLVELGEVDRHEGRIRIGAMVTHSALARAMPARSLFRGLVAAARKSANPAVRNAATVGGNIATTGFRAPDIVTALLGLRATVDYVVGPAASELATVDLDDFLANPPTRPHLIIAVTVPELDGTASHVRLPLRGAGDYPVAIVSAVSAESAQGGGITIAYGAVGPRPSRWTALEQCLAGTSHSPGSALEHARRLAEDVVTTASVGVPSAYRRAVLSTLVHRAMGELRQTTAGAGR